MGTFSTLVVMSLATAPQMLSSALGNVSLASAALSVVKMPPYWGTTAAPPTGGRQGVGDEVVSFSWPDPTFSDLPQLDI